MHNVCMAGADRSWTDVLDDAERTFIKRFVLNSGSLKAMAAEYGVSYPTVRLRLDRLIQKIEIVEQAAEASAFERALRAKAADGKVDPAVLGELLKYHREDVRSASERNGRATGHADPPPPMSEDA